MTDDDRRAELDRTTPATEKELAKLRAARKEREGRLSLVLYHRDGVQAVPLFEGASLTVGRSQPADVILRDATLSAQHACFEVVDGEVWVEDLQSTNGTRVDGTLVERAAVPPGDEVGLGGVVATVQHVGAAESAGLSGHDQLLLELDGEVHRALSFGRGLALLMVRNDKSHMSRWLPELRKVMRPFDRVAVYSSNTAEVLVPEAVEETVRSLAAKVVEAQPDLRVGYGLLSERIRSADALLEAARTALQRAEVETPVQGATEPRAAADSLAAAAGEGPIAESAAMQKVFATVGRLADSVIPVLLQGETGSGKEVISQAIHDGGPRKGRPLVPVNCGAIPPQLVESTLFGHEKGAFTGASTQSRGVFESAKGGTVLLDEIGELPADAQAALLRVLETKKITRVGSSKEIDIDVRIIAATHRNLEEMCDEGAFRRDLLYRLDAMALRVPPLRKRPEDIAPLALRFLRMGNEANNREVRGLSDDAMALLLRYSWPGNVRELRNAIERAVVIALGEVIDVEDLPERVRSLGGEEPPEADEAPEPKKIESGSGEAINLKVEVQRFEADLILNALKKADWDRKMAAHSLGLPLRTLSHKMQVHGIKPLGYGKD